MRREESKRGREEGYLVVYVWEDKGGKCNMQFLKKKSDKNNGCTRIKLLQISLYREKSVILGSQK